MQISVTDRGDEDDDDVSLESFRTDRTRFGGVNGIVAAGVACCLPVAGGRGAGIGKCLCCFRSILAVGGELEARSLCLVFHAAAATPAPPERSPITIFLLTRTGILVVQEVTRATPLFLSEFTLASVDARTGETVLPNRFVSGVSSISPKSNNSSLSDSNSRSSDSLDARSDSGSRPRFGDGPTSTASSEVRLTRRIKESSSLYSEPEELLLLGWSGSNTRLGSGVMRVVVTMGKVEPRYIFFSLSSKQKKLHCARVGVTTFCFSFLARWLWAKL